MSGSSVTDLLLCLKLSVHVVTLFEKSHSKSSEGNRRDSDWERVFVLFGATLVEK